MCNDAKPVVYLYQQDAPTYTNPSDVDGTRSFTQISFHPTELSSLVSRLTDSFHLIRPREDAVCPAYRLAGKSADGHAVVSDSSSPEIALSAPYWTVTRAPC